MRTIVVACALLGACATARPAGHLCSSPVPSREPPVRAPSTVRGAGGLVRGLSGGPVARAGGACVGFYPEEPQAIVEVEPEVPLLVVARTIEDATLLIEAPDGSVLCSDDFEGLDPGITLGVPGAHRVFIGQWEEGRETSFRLETRAPEVLSAAPIPGVPTTCGLSTPDYGPLAPGVAVVLGRHTPWSGPDGRSGHMLADTWWNPNMNDYVGVVARVVELAGLDPSGCPYVRVDVDGGSWGWRVRNLAIPASGLGVPEWRPVPGAPLECGMTTAANYGSVRIGMRVVLHRHAGWSGSDGQGAWVSEDHWWNDGMSAYVGREATIVELGGLDPAGCPFVRVDVDGGEWGWRVRDLSLASEAPAGESTGAAAVE